AGDHGFRVHDDIDAEVRARTFGHDAILLNTERVPTENVSAPLIIERIEVDAHVVFAENVVAFGDRSADLVWLVETMKRKIESLRVVANHGFSRLGRSNVVAGLNLVEVLEDRCRLPNFIIKFAVNHGR